MIQRPKLASRQLDDASELILRGYALSLTACCRAREPCGAVLHPRCDTRTIAHVMTLITHAPQARCVTCSVLLSSSAMKECMHA